MFDVITYALLKKQIQSAATGIDRVEYKDGNLIFYLPDGSQLSTPLDIQSNVADALVNESGALVIKFGDGTSLTFAPPTQQDFSALKEKVETLETNQEELKVSQDNIIEAHTTLKNSFDDLGLSVVEGKLHITYEVGE